MPLMVPITLMPLPGAGAVAEGCQRLLGPSSSVAGDRHLLAALRHLRAEQRGYGTERQDKVISLASRTERTRELAFCRARNNLFEATPGTPFQVGHSKTPKANKRFRRPIEIHVELVRLRPTTLHTRKNQPVFTSVDIKGFDKFSLIVDNIFREFPGRPPRMRTAVSSRCRVFVELLSVVVLLW